MRYGGLAVCFMMACLGTYVADFAPDEAQKVLPAIIGIGLTGIAVILVDIANTLLRNRR